MDNQSFPTLDQERWTNSASDIEGRVGGVLDSADFYLPAGSPAPGIAAVNNPNISKPISSMMQESVRFVDGEDTVEKVDEVLSMQAFSSVPVMGSNGAIIGIIGPQELAHFHSEKKNAKAVRAWEISRCTVFEVKPDDSVEDVAKLMAENKIEYIAVTELGALKGAVSALDLERAISRERADEANASAASQGESAGRSRRHDD